MAEPILLGATGIGGAILLAADSFTDANNTHLNAHTMDIGSGWTEQNGTWQISSNKATAFGTIPAAPQFVATTATSASDVTVTDTINFSGANSSHAVILRYSDNSNFWFVSLLIGTSTFNLVERASGVSTTRASTSVTFNNGTDYVVQAHAVGQSITATVNGGNSITYNSAASNQTQKIHGIRSNDLNGTHDNFLVTTP